MSSTTNQANQETLRSRLEKGFTSWDKGYDMWLEWCDRLYEPDVQINLQSQRVSLQQCKDMIRNYSSLYIIEIGDFSGMLIQDDWCAVRYPVYITNRKTCVRAKQNTIQFIRFKDKRPSAGSRVIESWVFFDKLLEPMR